MLAHAQKEFRAAGREEKAKQVFSGDESENVKIKSNQKTNICHGRRNV